MSLLTRRRAMMGAKSEQGLPAEYQQVEYAAHTATTTAYINNIGPYKDVDTIVLDLEFKAKTKYGLAIVVAKSGPAFPCGDVCNAKSIQAPDQRGYVCDPQKTISGPIPRETYTFEKLEGAKTHDYYCLFGWNNNNYMSNLKAYGAKMLSNGKVVFEGVLCYKVADGTIGIYDFKQRTFFPANGTWTKGADVL